MPTTATTHDTSHAALEREMERANLAEPYRGALRSMRLDELVCDPQGARAVICAIQYLTVAKPSREHRRAAPVIDLGVERLRRGIPARLPAHRA